MTYEELEQSLQARKFFGATPHEWRLMSALFLREQLYIKQIYPILWENPDWEPENPDVVIRTHISRLKKKLVTIGLTVQVVWGRGYFMSKDDRAKALKMAEEAMSR